MKTTTKTILLAAGLGAGLTLNSCVAPYDGTAVTTTTERTYSPGYTVNALPGGYRSEVVAGTNYYYHNGAYYQQRSNGYVVVIRSLPRRSSTDSCITPPRSTSAAKAFA
jgi:hypothetical protein